MQALCDPWIAFEPSSESGLGAKEWLNEIHHMAMSAAKPY